MGGNIKKGEWVKHFAKLLGPEENNERTGIRETEGGGDDRTNQNSTDIGLDNEISVGAETSAKKSNNKKLHEKTEYRQNS